MRRSPLRVELSSAERSTLEHWLRCTSTANGLAQRIRVVLRFADGQRIVPIGRELGLARNTVKLWLRRFSEKRLEGLDDQPRSGRPLVFSPRGGRTPGETGLRATG
jgi:hypothetical protein